MKNLTKAIAALAAVVVASVAPARGQTNFQYPTIPYTSIQPTDYILLEGPRFTTPVYTTFPIMADWFRANLGVANFSCSGSTWPKSASGGTVTCVQPQFSDLANTAMQLFATANTWTVPQTFSAITVPALPGLTSNVASTGIPGLNGGQWMVYSAPSTLPSYVGVFRSQFDPSYTGGTAGVVRASHYNVGTVGSGVVDYIWLGMDKLTNNATGGQNVARYMQALKNSGAGPTWATVSEARDTSNTSNPTSGLVAHEVDLFVNGTDSLNQRVATDYVFGKHNSGGAAAEFGYGIRFAAYGGVAGDATIKKAVYFNTATYTTFIGSAPGAVVTDGIDFSATTFTGSVWKSSGLTISGAGNITGTTATTFTAGALAATAGGTNGYLRIVASGGSNYLQSGTQNVTSSAAPLIIGSINGGATWATISSTGIAINADITTGSTTLHKTSVALANGAAAATATLTNAPTAGNPTKWVPINDNGTTRYFPAW